MVDMAGIEPAFRRCERRVLPLYHTPDTGGHGENRTRIHRLPACCSPVELRAQSWSRFRDVRPAIHITNVVLRYLSLSGKTWYSRMESNHHLHLSEGCVLSPEARVLVRPARVERATASVGNLYSLH